MDIGGVKARPHGRPLAHDIVRGQINTPQRRPLPSVNTLHAINKPPVAAQSQVTSARSAVHSVLAPPIPMTEPTTLSPRLSKESRLVQLKHYAEQRGDWRIIAIKTVVSTLLIVGIGMSDLSILDKMCLSYGVVALIFMVDIRITTSFALVGLLAISVANGFISQELNAELVAIIFYLLVFSLLTASTYFIIAQRD